MWYRFNGKQIAFTGNNGTLDTDYAASIAARTKVPAGTYAFRHGDWNGPAVTDYDPSLEHINSYGQGSAGGGYTVRAGDTLQGIALGLWGDASLWYKLAEANGLTAAAGLIEGRSLIVPHGVQANHHNASTLKPYDPADTIGDASPTTPKPQKKGGKCGVFGQILLVAIAVAVSVVTYGAMAPHMAGFFGAVVAGAASSAAGSIASQAFGVATGIQDKFSFKQVAMAAIAGGVSGGVGNVLGQAGVAGSKILTGIVRGAASSALTQGIGVALGLQKKFDFAGVAAAGIGSGLAAAIGGQPLNKNISLANHLTHAGAGAASAIANAATRSLINGTDFGDNLMAALPDIIGSTLGNIVAEGIGAKSAASSTAYHGDGISEAFELDDGPSGMRPTAAEAVNDWQRELDELNAAIQAIENSAGRESSSVGLAGQRPEPGEQGWNPFRDAGEDYFNRLDSSRQTTLRRLVALRDQLRNLASDPANELANSLRGVNSRDLTRGERAILNRVFGKMLDLSDIKIVRGYGDNPFVEYAFTQENRPAMTFGNTVYLNEDVGAYASDLSRGSNPGQRRVNIDRLAHEFMHVVQFQRLGIWPVTVRVGVERGRYGKDGAYDYEGPALGGRTFGNLSLEAQAQMVGHYTMMRETGRFDAREGRIFTRITARMKGSGIYGM